MLVLDTDVLIDVQCGHAAALAWFASLTDLPSVPGLAVMELCRAQNPRPVKVCPADHSPPAGHLADGVGQTGHWTITRPFICRTTGVDWRPHCGIAVGQSAELFTISTTSTTVLCRTL